MFLFEGAVSAFLERAGEGRMLAIRVETPPSNALSGAILRRAIFSGQYCSAQVGAPLGSILRKLINRLAWCEGVW